MIKLVATDMDGTLLNDKKELPKDFCSFAASHKDIKMVIASGRQYFNLIKTFPNNVEDFIFIADNGAVVFEKGKPLFIDSIDMDVVEELLKEIHKIEGVACVLCGAKSAYISTVDDIALKNIQMYYAKVKFEMMKWSVSQIVTKEPKLSREEKSSRPKKLKKSEPEKEAILDAEIEPVEKEEAVEAEEAVEVAEAEVVETETAEAVETVEAEAEEVAAEEVEVKNEENAENK